MPPFGLSVGFALPQPGKSFASGDGHWAIYSTHEANITCTVTKSIVIGSIIRSQKGQNALAVHIQRFPDPDELMGRDVKGEDGKRKIKKRGEIERWEGKGGR